MRVDGDSIAWPGAVLTRLHDTISRFGRDLFPDPRGVLLPKVIALPVHAFLLQRDGEAPLLIDTGEGGADGVAAALARLGVAKCQIETVVFTHLHGDHRGGYLAGGYESARVCMSEIEATYWERQDHPARKVLELAGGRLQRLGDCDEVVPGLRVWALPGHTPGHIGLVLDNRIAIVGDLLHRVDLQLADHDLATRFDVDARLATATRKAALQHIGARDMVFCGGHIRLPGQEEALEGSAFLRLQHSDQGWQARPA
ncbi:MAG: MBL fold metallo-hydrolase [Paracoccaceae bacterium]